MSGALWYLYRNDNDLPPWWFWFLLAGILIGVVVWLS